MSVAMPGTLGAAELESRPDVDLVDGRFYADPHAALRWMR